MQGDKSIRPKKDRVKMALISLIIPAHNEATCFPSLFAEISNAKANMSQDYADLSFEVIVVDDGSTDDTIDVLKDISRTYSDEGLEIKWISFSRNFGKESAILAGLRNADGDFVATMDADLQDPPSLLPEMYSYLQSGEYDSVATFRKDRKGEPKIRSAFSSLFYRIINAVSDTEIMNGARDYRLMNRKMVDSILELSEYNRFSKGIYSWVGFNTKWLPFENVERVNGKTNWSFLKLVSYSMDGITAFSTKPLLVASMSGFFLCLIAAIAAAVIIGKTLLFGDPVPGWPSLACILLFVGGLQLLCIGIIGQYLAKTYLEAKNRPAYFIKESHLGNDR